MSSEKCKGNVFNCGVLWIISGSFIFSSLIYGIGNARMDKMEAFAEKSDDKVVILAEKVDSRIDIVEQKLGVISNKLDYLVQK